jgi:fermentation-respiration switch protein FrsA (DUF1100 family)
VPVLVMHGDDDQIVPYVASGPMSAKFLKNGTRKTYKGFPHGMPTTEAETIKADLLAFSRSQRHPKLCWNTAEDSAALPWLRSTFAAFASFCGPSRL